MSDVSNNLQASDQGPLALLRQALHDLLCAVEQLASPSLDDGGRGQWLLAAQRDAERMRGLVDELTNFLTQSSSSDTPSSEAQVPEIADLQRDFAAELPARLAEAKTAWTAGDNDAVARCAHRLKGAAAMYGFDDLSETAGLLEAAIREEQNADLIAELLDELAQAVESARPSSAADALAGHPPSP